MKRSTTPLFDYHDNGATKRKYGRTTHGGMKSKGRRKEYRPLAEKKWIHITLKSEKAKGKWSFLLPKNRTLINETLKQKGQKWGVQVADLANVGNHLHIKVKFKYRKGFQNFLRAVTTILARKITGAKRGNKVGTFWQGLAFTRVIKTSFEELQLRGYFEANRKQAAKGEKAREAYLKAFNDWIRKMRDGDRSTA